MYKCYCDASYFKNSNGKNAIIAYIMLDSNDKMLFQNCKKIIASSSLEAEFCSIRSLVSKLMQMGFKNSDISIYNDNKSLVEKINSQGSLNSINSNQWTSLVNTLKKYDSIKLSWIERNYNIADKIIRDKIKSEPIINIPLSYEEITQAVVVNSQKDHGTHFKEDLTRIQIVKNNEIIASFSLNRSSPLKIEGENFCVIL